MSMATLSIIILVALFAATLIPAFDLGLGALAAAFLIGLAADVATDDVTGFFPADFFVLIVGVTALFAVAHLNGTLDWLLDLLLRLVRGRLVLIVLVPFVIGAVLTAVGTLPAAATAIVSPIALGFAARYRISPLIAAVLGVTGIISGLLSPLAVYGVTARELSEKQGLGLPGSAPVTFLLGGLVTGLVVCTALLIVGTRTGAVPPGRISGAPRPATPEGPAPDDLAPDDPAPGGGGSGGGGSEAPGAAPVSTAKGGTATVVSTPPAETADQPPGVRALTIGALLAVVVLSVGWDMHVGYLGVTAALLLQLAFRLPSGEIVSRIPWNVVLLIGGLLTYVGLMQHLGAFKQISDMLRVDGSPLLSLLVLCYIAGVTSFAASSIAVFVTTMPLLPPLVADGVSPVGGVLALALASVLVDINPLGITGGLILGAAEPSARPRLFRQLLIYGLVSIPIAPFLTWLAFGWW
ncbi:Dicarboxylate carrier protein MatC N-terminus [Actinomadura madurae]|uniref:Dicarboxylate carrier protein MatC N-terminus n=1 Tax=Actinomadura madurae TaxID=1993 RepID=A0A1I5Y2V0_9ACTN|nr:SLC13 family permease [Actinomadura madurae]SFQ38523.1 Dicarboxylate carrier protein MatC N-terminus [Actinomadura madurae]